MIKTIFATLKIYCNIFKNYIISKTNYEFAKNYLSCFFFSFFYVLISFCDWQSITKVFLLADKCAHPAGLVGFALLPLGATVCIRNIGEIVERQTSEASNLHQTNENRTLTTWIVSSSSSSSSLVQAIVISDLISKCLHAEQTF